MKTVFGCMRFIIDIEIGTNTVYINFTFPASPHLPSGSRPVQKGC